MSKLPFQPISFCGLSLCALCFNCSPELRTFLRTFSGKNLNRYCGNTKKKTACFAVIPSHDQKPSAEISWRKKVLGCVSNFWIFCCAPQLLSSSEDNRMVKGYSSAVLGQPYGLALPQGFLKSEWKTVFCVLWCLWLQCQVLIALSAGAMSSGRKIHLFTLHGSDNALKKEI